DRFAAMAVAGLAELRRRKVQRLVPGDARELPVALAAAADLGMEQARLAIDVLGQAAHLGADETRRQRVAPVAVQLDHPPALDRDREAAGVGAVEGTGAAQDDAAGAVRGRAGEGLRHTPIVDRARGPR